LIVHGHFVNGRTIGLSQRDINYNCLHVILNLYFISLVSTFQKTMLASAKSKAHQAFKSGNYLVAVRIYDEVYLHLAYYSLWTY
jgi:hypothetical protein